MSVKLLRHEPAEKFSGKIQLSIDRESYQNKPEGAEIGAIRNRLGGHSAAYSIDIETLANEINNGHTIQGAILRDKQNKNEDTDSRFEQQQLFIVDLDNDKKIQLENGEKVKVLCDKPYSTPEQIQSRAAAAGLTPCFIAESFSSGKKDINGAIIPKYHVGFAAAEQVKDVKQSRRILFKLLDVFPGADEACKDPARIIFGTAQSKQVYYSYAVNSLETLLNCSPAEPEEPEQPPQLPSSEPAPKAKRTQSTAPKASGKKGSMSDFTRDLKENKTDPDRLLFMIDPNTLDDYSQWFRALSSYKLFDGATIENFDTWNRQYTGANANYKGDLKTYKGAKGKGIDKMSLHAIAEEKNPEEYNNYMQELISLYKKPARASRKQASGAGQSNSAESSPQSTGELIPLELPFERPANYVDFAFKDSKNKIIIIPQLLAENVRKTCKYIFVKGSDPAEAVRRFWYEHGVYIPIADEHIKNVLRSRIQPFGISLCKKSYIEEAFYQLTIDNAFHADIELNADENIINFKNGLLHLDTMQITPHTPEFMSTIQIPCNYNPQLTLENAPVFDRFITHLANDDKDSKQTLLEYIGAAISNVNGAHFKKALFLKGAGNCGKSQYIELLSRLLSERYFGSQSLDKLESRFGKYALYNKRVVGDPDIKFMKMAELATFKQITGGDPIDLESKGKNSFTYKYKGLLLFGCNRAPLFSGDRGQWVYDRMLFINCGDPIPETEQDPLIADKMYNEREAIAAAAIAALKTAIKNRYTFTESLESKKTLTAYKAENDIVQEFIIDCCVIRKNHKYNDNVTQQALFNAFLTWARNCNYRSLPSLREFRRSLSEFVGVDIKELDKKSNGKRYYIYTLTDEMKKELGVYDSIKSINESREIY